MQPSNDMAGKKSLPCIKLIVFHFHIVTSHHLQSVGIKPKHEVHYESNINTYIHNLL